MEQPYELKPVSNTLQATLNQVARKSTNKIDDVATLLNSENFASYYNACIWWDGCYYCQDEDDSWYCIKCSFF